MYRMRPIDTVDGLGLHRVGALGRGSMADVRDPRYWDAPRGGLGDPRGAPDSDRIAGICLCGPRSPAIRPCSPGACHIGIDPGSLAFPISLPVHVEDDMKRLLVLLLCAPLLLFASTSE